MPVTIKKLGDGRCRVSTPHGVKAKNTTCGNAEKQKRLLNAVDHGFKPTGESVKIIATQLVSTLLEAPGGIRPFDQHDHMAFGGAEGTPWIGDLVIDGKEGSAIAENSGVQVIVTDPETNDVSSWQFHTPFAQAKAMLPAVIRATTSAELQQMGFEQVA